MFRDPALTEIGARASTSGQFRQALHRSVCSVCEQALRANMPIRAAGTSGHLGPADEPCACRALLAPRNRKRTWRRRRCLDRRSALSSLRSHCAGRLSLCLLTMPFGWIAPGLLAISIASQMRDLTDRLIANEIGTAYVYVSSLGIDRRWAGGPRGQGQLHGIALQVVADFVRSFKSQHDKLACNSAGSRFGRIWTMLMAIGLTIPVCTAISPTLAAC